jgi:predicted N-formylglutamate amidohydrolase
MQNLSRNPLKLLITCEHGGNQIPLWLSGELKISDEILASHRGWDIGALSIAKGLRKIADAFFFTETSRLCIELNRSLHHVGLFSEYSKKLPKILKEKMLREIYEPYRHSVEQQIKTWIDQGFGVVHLSIHSFTPILNGEIRETEIGFLYDPGRAEEKSFCVAWKKNLKKAGYSGRVRFNYPYQGTADGFTTYLRKKFQQGYLGIEVEINQTISVSEGVQTLQAHLIHALKAVLQKDMLN